MTTTDSAASPGFRVRDLRPGGFAFVMATGIVSTSIRNSGAHAVAAVMFVIAAVTYLIFCVEVLVRLVRRRRQADRGFMALTFVAATGVLGAHLAFLGREQSTRIFVIAAIVAWAVLGYTVATRVVTGSAMRSGLERVNGTWFLWVVSTQSVAVVCGAFAVNFGAPGLAIFSALCWSVGVLQLFLLGSLVFSRLALQEIEPGEPVAPYWIFMGSAAITVLSGAEILGLSTEQSLLEPVVVSTVSMVLWSFATWLFPLLIGLFVWQQLRRDHPWGFQTQWWSMVFPIGMYGESSRQLGNIRDTGWLESVGWWESWIALAVWLLACAAAAYRLLLERPARLRRARSWTTP